MYLSWETFGAVWFPILFALGVYCLIDGLLQSRGDSLYTNNLDSNKTSPKLGFFSTSYSVQGQGQKQDKVDFLLRTIFSGVRP